MSGEEYVNVIVTMCALLLCMVFLLLFFGRK